MDFVEFGMVEVAEHLEAEGTRLRELESLVQPQAFAVALQTVRSSLEIMAEQLRILGSTWHDHE